MNEKEMSVYDLIRSLSDEQLNSFIGQFNYIGDYVVCESGFNSWDLKMAVKTIYEEYIEDIHKSDIGLDEDLKKYYEEAKKNYIRRKK